MKIVGLTGGIGAGKSVVAHLFHLFNIPIYNADQKAKALMNNSPMIKQGLLDLYGDKAFVKGELNREHLARIVFSDSTEIKKINALVHPYVRHDFNEWKNKNENKAPYLIKEAAILLNNGKPSDIDSVITISSPKFIRKQNILKRDPFRTEEEIENIFKIQTQQAVLEGMSDFVIINDGMTSLIERVNNLHILLSIPANT